VNKFGLNVDAQESLLIESLKIILLDLWIRLSMIPATVKIPPMIAQMLIKN
jgi:hypothetical protein